MRTLFHSAGLLFNVILSLTSAKLLAKPSAPSLPLAVTELRSFGDKTWAENIAVRSNDQLLVTCLDTPILQLLDPTNKTTPITLHSFNTTIYIGLPNSDIFYVALQIPYIPDFTKITKFPNVIFKVDLRTFSSKAGTLISVPTVSQNIADSTLGHIYNLNLSTISYTIPLKLPSMSIPPNTAAQLGVNDDFIIREDGKTFICGKGQDTLSMRKKGLGEAVAMAGSNTSTILADVTAGAFERVTERGGKTLLLTTSSAQAQPINGTATAGAAVSYVDTECL